MANNSTSLSGIPSSTLYKIARREGIRLATPFNAAPTTWTQDDLEKALEAIRTGQTTVQKAATEYGIPTGTLYGRCKREKIELSRSNPTPWSQDAMAEALEAIRYSYFEDSIVLLNLSRSYIASTLQLIPGEKIFKMFRYASELKILKSN